ncbi:MAG: hypothetical protein PVI30_21460 [Myxococcales bacterium]|jgi:hypothetical protein
MQQRQQNAIASRVSDRTPRPLMAPSLRFDLAAEGELLRREAPWRERGHNARTLVKHSEFRLVLVALAEQAGELEQQVDERVCIQTLHGSLEVHLPSEVVTLPAGGLLALEQGLAFRVSAAEETDFLLWIGWSRD